MIFENRFVECYSDSRFGGSFDSTDGPLEEGED
jgi:hypothetical protein